ncbi:MAG: hypothetical protein R3D98_10520 [Candidatus Krumholzibacteriia bacterium]
MKPSLIVLTVLLAVAALADPPPELLWQRSWNGLQDYSDEARRVAVDMDGAVVVVGSSHTPTQGQRTVLQRYAADGTLLWTRIDDHLGGTTITDLRLDADGAAVFTAMGHDSQLGTYLSLMKVDTQGDTVWENRTHGDLVGFIALNSRLDRDGDGNWCTYAPLANTDILVWTVDPQGQTLWSRILDAGGTELPSDIAFGTDGSVYLAGLQAPDFNLSARYAAAGDSLWSVMHPVEVGAQNLRVAALSDGGAVFTSNDEMETLGIPASFTWRMAADGTVLWRGRYPEPMEFVSVEVAEMLVTDDDRIIVLGTGGLTSARFHAQCFDAQGQELWLATAAGAGTSNIMAAAAMGPSGSIVAGGSDNPGASGTVFFLVGLTPDGAVAWTRTWNLTPGRPDRLNDVAVGPDGSIVAVGFSWTGAGNGGDQWSVVKFAAPLSDADDVPTATTIAMQAYPNPFNPMTRIRYTVPTPGPVRLAVYDAAGRLVCTWSIATTRRAGMNRSGTARMTRVAPRPAAPTCCAWSRRPGWGRAACP